MRYIILIQRKKASRISLCGNIGMDQPVIVSYCSTNAMPNLSISRREKSAKDLRENNLDNIAPRFGSDLDGTIEENPRHSTAMLRIFRLRSVLKMARRIGCEMSKLFSLRSSRNPESLLRYPDMFHWVCSPARMNRTPRGWQERLLVTLLVIPLAVVSCAAVPDPKT